MDWPASLPAMNVNRGRMLDNVHLGPMEENLFQPAFATHTKIDDPKLPSDLLLQLKVSDPEVLQPYGRMPKGNLAISLLWGPFAWESWPCAPLLDKSIPVKSATLVKS
jgi:hypothetical protein